MSYSASWHVSCFFSKDIISDFHIYKMKIKTLKEKEKEHLETVLAKTHWDINKSARLLRITQSQTKRKIKEYGLKKPDSVDPNPA